MDLLSFNSLCGSCVMQPNKNATSNRSSLLFQQPMRLMCYATEVDGPLVLTFTGFQQPMRLMCYATKANVVIEGMHHVSTAYAAHVLCNIMKSLSIRTAYTEHSFNSLCGSCVMQHAEMVEIKKAVKVSTAYAAHVLCNSTS